MRFHLASIGDSRCKYLYEEYIAPTSTLSVGDITEKKYHNTMMIDIASALSYEEFDEIKDCENSFEMCNKLKEIYGGDDNLRRSKTKCVRGQFDQMRIREDENIAKYVERVKANVNAIKASRGEIKDETVVSKVLKTLLPIYSIRVSAIQERMCETNHKIALDALMGRLTAFELDNYDNYVPASKNIELHLRPNFHLRRKARK